MKTKDKVKMSTSHPNDPPAEPGTLDFQLSTLNYSANTLTGPSSPEGSSVWRPCS